MLQSASPLRLSLVAPHAGAWIEMACGSANGRGSAVAPHAGAWIEMQFYGIYPTKGRVAPPCGARGLKSLHRKKSRSEKASRPHAGRVD